MDKLEPCPFCGGKAIIETVDLKRHPCFGETTIACETAGCVKPIAVGLRSPDEAIAAWNTRTPAKREAE